MAEQFFSPNDESDQAEKDEYYEGMSAIEKKVTYAPEKKETPRPAPSDIEDDKFNPEEEFGPEIIAPAFGSEAAKVADSHPAPEEAVIIKFVDGGLLRVSKNLGWVLTNPNPEHFTQKESDHSVLNALWFAIEKGKAVKITKGDKNAVVNPQTIITIETA